MKPTSWCVGSLPLFKAGGTHGQLSAPRRPRGRAVLRRADPRGGGRACRHRRHAGARLLPLGGRARHRLARRCLVGARALSRCAEVLARERRARAHPRRRARRERRGADALARRRADRRARRFAPLPPLSPTFQRPRDRVGGGAHVCGFDPSRRAVSRAARRSGDGRRRRRCDGLGRRRALGRPAAPCADGRSALGREGPYPNAARTRPRARARRAPSAARQRSGGARRPLSHALPQRAAGLALRRPHLAAHRPRGHGAAPVEPCAAGARAHDPAVGRAVPAGWRGPARDPHSSHPRARRHRLWARRASAVLPVAARAAVEAPVGRVGVRSRHRPERASSAQCSSATLRSGCGALSRRSPASIS